MKSPLIGVVGMAALLVGYLLGRFTGSGSGNTNRRLTNAADVALTSFSDTDADENGATPLWINYTLARMWSLFQKNTKLLIQNTIQPVLDETPKPDFLKAVQVLQFMPGRQAPIVQSLRRLPSRALSEVQYAIRIRLASSSVASFQVDVGFGRFQFPVTATLQNLDVDANCWVGLVLAPYEPFCTSVQYALLESPRVSFDMTVAGFIPITAIPVLRSFFFRVLTEEIPKQFIFPKTVLLDFTPEHIRRSRAGYSATGKSYDEMTEEDLIKENPEQWALFDSLDLDGGGSLSGVELFVGLKDWGYTAEDASKSFAKLDLNNDDSVSFREFCQMWPMLASSFIPNRYEGVLTVFLRRAEGLPRARFGSTDPCVRFRLNEQEVDSKLRSQTLGDNSPGRSAWMETFNLNCLDATEEELEVIVLEKSRWSPFKNQAIAKATIPLTNLTKVRNYRMCTKLEPEGTIWLDLSYADYFTTTTTWRNETDSSEDFSMNIVGKRGRRVPH